MTERRPPPPLPRKAKAPTRHRIREKTPGELEGHARVKAAKLCSASMYLAITGAVLMFIPFAPPGGGPLGAVAAIVTGIWGLVRLATLGRPAADLAAASPIERVGARMAARAKGQAGIGIGLGLAIVVFYAVLILSANREKERQREEMDEFRQHFEEILREHRGPAEPTGK